MKAVATICSRHKRRDAALLPAQDRYAGEHVKKAGAIADSSKFPFYILSGKYGIISADTEIPDYDYYLEQEHVAALTKIVGSQLMEAGITELDFYIEDKASWAPYIAAMQEAAASTGVALNVRRS
ncbi:MAG TPA: hypothetical protein VGN56_02005 [Candidatus Paceibacterota bacterium]|jgi:hypothetical protein|nr:hypothetical protein [Candidatus Paceibacterota bacterium]